MTAHAPIVVRPVIAQVQPLTTTRRLSGPFDYALPEQPLRVGSIVRVPFGRQALDGVVVGLAEHSELAPERRVQQRDGVSESRLEAPDRLRRQRDLGHEHDHSLAALQGRRRRAQVHLGLAGAGDAGQEVRAAALDRPDGRLLLGGERQRTVRPRAADTRAIDPTPTGSAGRA